MERDKFLLKYKRPTPFYRTMLERWSFFLRMSNTFPEVLLLTESLFYSSLLQSRLLSCESAVSPKVAEYTKAGSFCAH